MMLLLVILNFVKRHYIATRKIIGEIYIFSVLYIFLYHIKNIQILYTYMATERK